MSLGSNFHITIGVDNLAECRAYYEELGFRRIDGHTEPYPWVQLYDGQLIIALHQDGHLYHGLTYFGAELAERVAGLEKVKIEFRIKNEHDNQLVQAIFVAQNDIPISLVNFPSTPPARTINPLLGKFGEYSLGVADLQSAIDYWQTLGFQLAYRTDQPYPWAILSDGLLVLGLHQTDNFSGPILTYFAADMEEKVVRLRADDPYWIEDLPEVGGYETTAPDGQRFFLFQGNIP
jgi:catechol 2,3-dioxygenase-like lactoylglutathione lyase family enzyme